jgi:hypothetical protein
LVVAASAAAQAAWIDNDLPEGTPGRWEVDVLSGGSALEGNLTAQRVQSGDIWVENVLFEYLTFVDTGERGEAFLLDSEPAALVGDDVVESRGSFLGEYGQIVRWTCRSAISDLDLVMTSRYRFETEDGSPLGRIRLYQYLDEDVEWFSDDVFFSLGSSSTGDLELFTVDNLEAYGVSQSGVLTATDGLFGATFAGWAMDQYNDMQPRIYQGTQEVSPNGVTAEIGTFNHPVFGRTLGPADIVSTLAWDTDPSASSAEIVTAIGGTPDPVSTFTPPPTSDPGPTLCHAGDGAITPTRPTIVLIHGLQNEGDWQDPRPTGLWTGDGVDQAMTLIREALGSGAADYNVVQYVWRDAFQNRLAPDLQSYNRARERTPDAAGRLVGLLSTALGSDYSRPIHVVGHSLGSVVGALTFRELMLLYPSAKGQFTALDRPDHIDDRLVGADAEAEARWGFSDTWFESVLREVPASSRPIRADNYYALDGAGVGDVARGRIFYNRLLSEPHEVGDRLLESEAVDNNHTGVHQWYRWTILHRQGFATGPDVCIGDAFDPATRPDGINDTLNPCLKGWAWSQAAIGLAWPQGFPEPNGGAVTVASASPLELAEVQSFGCTVSPLPGGTAVVCGESAGKAAPSAAKLFPSPDRLSLRTWRAGLRPDAEKAAEAPSRAPTQFAVLDVDVPTGADFLHFRYRFSGADASDMAVLLIDNIPVWNASGEGAVSDGFGDSGPVPVEGFRGPHRITWAVYGSGSAVAEAELRELRTTTMASVAVDSDLDGIPDEDDDGVSDPCRGAHRTGCDDNCPGSSNPGQSDADLDGTGDACDGEFDPAGRDAAYDEPEPVSSLGWATLGVGDLDGDGDPDLLLDGYRWYENSLAVDGQLLERAFPGDAGFGQFPNVSDLNGDGDADAVTANASLVHWFENQGGSPPAFVAHDLRLIEGFARELYYIALPSDIDLDGNVDLLTSTWVEREDGSTSGLLSWHENAGTSPLAFTTRAIVEDAWLSFAVRVGDIDGDGAPDAVSRSSDGRIDAWMNTPASPGTFRRVQVTAESGDEAWNDYLALGDVDGDGDVDVVADREDALGWYENGGGPSPSFAPRTVSDGPFDVLEAVLADVDSDGNLDIVVGYGDFYAGAGGSAVPNRVSWFRNNGARPPSFSERPVETERYGIMGVVVPDLDLDGRPDMVTSSIWDGRVDRRRNGPAFVCSGSDADGDGWRDTCDLCSAVSDRGQRDYDDDGLGDACEGLLQASDVDRSGRVDGVDLSAIARPFARSCGERSYSAAADLDRDGKVDGDDLSILASGFGKTTGGK